MSKVSFYKIHSLKVFFLTQEPTKYIREKMFLYIKNRTIKVKN